MWLLVRGSPLDGVWECRVHTNSALFVFRSSSCHDGVHCSPIRVVWASARSAERTGMRHGKVAGSIPAATPPYGKTPDRQHLKVHNDPIGNRRRDQVALPVVAQKADPRR